MIVTRSWLEEYINLEGISNIELINKLNSIGLEVDSVKEYNIPEGVVVGKITACSKHPNADKLSLCTIDIGSESVQIICGASNVVNAEYVAVATIGTILPENFKIKKAKLRGVESFGMVCSSEELGLPKVEDGIMILDDSIGELVVGRELREYKRVADTVIDIELTANRGDCLSIYGVARDLSAAFKRELKSKRFKDFCGDIGSVREARVEVIKPFNGKLEYNLVTLKENLKVKLLTKLRTAFTELEIDGELDTIISYASHASGVILRGYDFNKLKRGKDNRVRIDIEEISQGVVEVRNEKSLLSLVGINQNSEFKADDNSERILVEASYINPEDVVEGVNSNGLEVDKFYYNSSRGSEPDVKLGMESLKKSFCYYLNQQPKYNKNSIKIGDEIKPKTINVDFDRIIAIIGDKRISKSEIANILLALGFTMSKVHDYIIVSIPPYRHDISNIYDIAEEVLRIYGIDNIESKPLLVLEKNRINDTYLKFRDIEGLLNRAVSAGFFNAITYAFNSRERLLEYGCEVVEEDLDLINPIVNELNTLRTNISLNLIEAASRNIKYGKKSVALFEIGTIFNSKREEIEAVSFLFSGEDKRAGIEAGPKAKMVDFASFIERIGSVIGDFRVVKSEPKNLLMHPYLTATVIKDNKEIGTIYKVHPKVTDDFKIPDTFVAELKLENLLSKKRVAKPLSNYQPVSKDLSVVLDSRLSFYYIAEALNRFKAQETLLKDFYPLDIYRDDSLGDKMSLTIRFTLQSNEKTLSDSDIDRVMNSILKLLEESFGASLR